MSGIGKVWKEIGANVRNFRKRGGLSQEKLGEKADLLAIYISQVERWAKAQKPPKPGICGVKCSFQGSCASVAKRGLANNPTRWCLIAEVRDSAALGHAAAHISVRS